MSAPTISDACEVLRQRCINAVGGEAADLTLANMREANQLLVLVGLDINAAELGEIAMERALASTNAVTLGMAGPVQAFATAWADGLLTGRILGAMANEKPPIVYPAAALHPPTLEACRQAVLRTLDDHLGQVPHWAATDLATRRDAAWAATDAVIEELVRHGGTP